MPDRLAEAAQILADTIVVDTLGGAVVHPTPHVTSGTYEENLVRCGFSALHVTLVSEPSYTPTWEQVQHALYENLLNFAMSPKLRHIERVEDLYEAKRNGQLGVILGIQSPSCIGHERERLRLLHKLGLRSLQLTYMERNFLGDGCLEPENRGLTHFGMQVVRECNRLGISSIARTSASERRWTRSRSPRSPSSYRIRPSARSPTTRAASPTTR